MGSPNRLLSHTLRKLLESIDWDCADQYHQRSSLNIVHWHPASFITAIPGNVIDIFSSEGDVVWDPFCGSGTAAVEAVRKGRCFYGSDISEVAILISQAKANIVMHRPYFGQTLSNLRGQLQGVDLEAEHKEEAEEYYQRGLSCCSFQDLQPWYNDKVLRTLVSLWGFLQRYRNDGIIMPILFAVFLNIAKIACAQQKTWGHVADNMKPNLQQLEERKIDVVASYLSRLKQIWGRSEKVLVVSSTGSCVLNCVDARKYKPEREVDLVVTSPPYPCMADYVTSQRLAYYWLGFDVSHINLSKKSEIGARYLRHNSTRNDSYLENMILAFDNIISNVKKGGILAIMLPDYSYEDLRRKTMSLLYGHLHSRLDLLHIINRNVDEMNRWAPFRKLKNENLSIWSK